MIQKHATFTILLLNFLLLCVTYVTANTVPVQIAVYGIVGVLYVLAPKTWIRDKQLKAVYIGWIVLALWWLARIVIDLGVDIAPQRLYGSDLSLYVFFLCIILIPAIFMPNLDFSNLRLRRLMIILLVVIGICLISSMYTNMSQGVDIRNPHHMGRFEANQELSFLGYALLGVIIFSIAVTLLHDYKELYQRLLLLGVIAVALITITLSGTRSATVAVAVIVILYSVATRRYAIMACAAVVIFCFFFFEDGIRQFFLGFDSHVVDRFYDSINSDGDISSGRNFLWSIAWEDIMQHPILGSTAFFHHVSQPYVHNSFLEVFRAIGIFGAALFVVLNAYTVYMGYKLIRMRSDFMFFPMVFVGYLVCSMFSETLLRLPMYWLMAFATLAVYNYEKNRLPEGDQPAAGDDVEKT